MIDTRAILCHFGSQDHAGALSFGAVEPHGRKADGESMSEDTDRDAWASSPLAGLAPSRSSLAEHSSGRHRAPHSRTTPDFGRVSRNVLATMPIVLVGTLAMSTLNLVGVPTTADKPKDAHDHSADTSDLSAAVGKAIAASRTRTSTPSATLASEVTVAAVSVPKTYTVKHGDTVSGIAAKYKLATASVLALNGLSWKSIIFPGQVLKLVKTTTSKPSAPATPPVTPPASSSGSKASTTYTIKSGDTVTSIAKKFGVTIQAILTANDLKVTSIIYAGRSLVIPGTPTSSSGSSSSGGSSSSSGSSSGSGTSTASTGTATTPLSPTMQKNAVTIISVGQKLNVPKYGIIVALATAMQESGLRNLKYGDLDSVGLFQQRPSAGWGTVAQLENETYAAELFYGGPSNPNKGKTRGLLDISGWQQMTLTQAAQAVQISASPNAYAKWQASATAWYADLT